MKTYNFDAAGNPLSEGTVTFTWNAAGKLSAAVKNATTHTYKTNALDQRISKNGPPSSKFFFSYDPDGQLIGEYRDNASTATPTDDWLVRQETIWLDRYSSGRDQKTHRDQPDPDLFHSCRPPQRAESDRESKQHPGLALGKHPCLRRQSAR